MKEKISNILKMIVQPFYWSGIGNFFPFNYFYKWYSWYANNVVFGSKKQIIKKTSYWFKMYLEKGKFIDTEIAKFGIWEPHISKLLEKYLQKWEVFLDLWANIGYESLLASYLVGASGKIIAFEPNQKNYKRLQDNISLNAIKNIETYSYGAWDKNYEISLYYDDHNPGATSVIQRKQHHKDGEIIEIKKLDDFLWDRKVDFIKMDIEGFEYEAILGMKKILQQPNIKMVFEYSPMIYKQKEKDYDSFSIRILDYLKGLGFHLYHVHFNGSMEVIENNTTYYHELSNWIGQSDIFCIKHKL